MVNKSTYYRHLNVIIDDMKEKPAYGFRSERTHTSKYSQTATPGLHRCTGNNISDQISLVLEGR